MSGKSISGSDKSAAASSSSSKKSTTTTVTTTATAEKKTAKKPSEKGKKGGPRKPGQPEEQTLGQKFQEFCERFIWLILMMAPVFVRLQILVKSGGEF